MDPLFDKIVSALSDSALPAHLESKSTSLLKLAKFQAKRLGHDQPYLIVSLLGPNNAGKSTVFTKFTGCNISPPAADGGFTRHLAAAAHPVTLDRLIAENHLGEFDIAEASTPLNDAQRRTVPPNSLFLARSTRTPQHLVVIDSPDFDSINDANHKVSAGLSRIADLIVCVVTKHTYSNATVRTVMSSAIERKRPYFVVYNEATDPQTARRHLKSLVGSFSSLPQQLLYAPFDINVQSNAESLQVLCVDDGRQFDLASLSADGVKRLLLKANASKLGKLAYGVEDLANAWAKHTDQVERFLDGIQDVAGELGRSVAAASDPIEPLRYAVIEVLNERDLWHKRARIPVQMLAKGVLWTGRRVRYGALVAGRWALRAGTELVDQKCGTHLRERIPEHQTTEEAPPKDTRPEAGLIDRETKTFDGEWKGFVEAISTKLRSASLQQNERASFEAEFHPDRISRIKDAILEDMAEDPIPEDYLDFCRREVRKTLDRRGNNEDLQWLATGIATAPAVAGIGTGVATGGLGGEDVAIAGTAVLMTPLFEKLVRLLGHDTAQRVQGQWIARRGRRIEEATLRACVPQTHRAWNNGISQARERIPQLEECAQELKDLVKKVEHDG